MSAHIIAQLLQGDKLDQGDLEALDAPWRGGALRIHEAAANGGDRIATYEDWLARSEIDGAAVRAAVERAAGLLYADPDAFTPDSGEVFVPPLPEEARIDPALGQGTGRWIDVYVRYAQAISPMTPRAFHESAALVLASVAIARRLVLRMPFDEIYPNLFVIWLAPTTLWRKSTALSVARRIAYKVLPHLMAAQESTPEAFLSDLAGREPTNMDAMTEEEKDEWLAGRDFAAQKGWVLDEMSGLMAASGKEYNAGLVEALLRFHDCIPQYSRSTRAQGRITVRNACLTLIGASTPAAMAAHLTVTRLWEMGWWARFAILTPPCAHPEWQEPQGAVEPPDLTHKLQALHARLPQASWPASPPALGVTLTQDAREAWDRYNEALSHHLLKTGLLDGRLNATYGRLPTQTLKVATILAALDWPGEQAAPHIDVPHLARAIAICEGWRESVHRLLLMATVSEFDQLSQRVTRQLALHEPHGATLRDIYKRMRDKEPFQIEECLSELVKLGDVEEIEWQNPRGGPKTRRYRLVRR